MLSVTHITRFSLYFIILLEITACTTNTRQAGYEWMKSVGLTDQRYATACGPAKKYRAAPDHGAGTGTSSYVIKRGQFEADRISDIPTDKFWYEGTQGVLMQRMRAEPRAALCPAGGKVEMRRPDQDYKFNQECCPPGLHFAGPHSTVIEGVPTHPGHYTTYVVLCGRCEPSMLHEYPLLFKIDWIIEGYAPRRLD